MTKIHPTAVIEASAQIGNDVVIGPNCYIDTGAHIGAGCILDANVVIGKNIKIGEKNIFYPNCVIGRNPQMLGATPDTVMGALEIGNNNIIREFVTIHPSIYTDSKTIIGNNNLIMVGVHIGHDCIVEDKTVLSNATQISGHCKIETGVWLSGGVMVQQFTTLGKWCYAAAMAGINHDIPPFVIVSGHYPPEVRLINKRGLVRAGLNEDQQKAVNQAFRFLYKSKTPLLENAKTLASENGIDENVKAMIDIIIRSGEHRYGRYLESLRRKGH
ncbi:MAG: acyl-[acyl-carrier-protein]--UDP-N-acetylglucosamine O-acyltransferase [Planctomycetes bacterium GWF2_41_51]|nr:MAG: acyl-[acyl-carrier-protein]--UDP-N-acetylglucosamine O-acyltransferase [Planctomycetes bacterium GWF2_41_51]HBG27386.1 acyl-[acyl-carrier-protein]--UDP-N-acetylglucosamine O-acyltransferase [Phycisphaerales bacterium]